MDTIAFNFFLNLPLYIKDILNMIKKTFLFLLIFYLVSCNNNEDYVGDWYLVEKNKFSNSEKINIKKAGDNGFIINYVYFSDWRWGKKTYYCEYENGCFVYKDKNKIWLCSSEDSLISALNGKVYRKK
ncbi:hypothetical protein [Flavobacterium sasangense]|uniref:hypothetical protein n=1 Tax=Flavobacterium sasangense TaxID=503361 RepID=UPI0004793CF6|nr:hypothetical protein [Flavobacterium sasangense]